MIFILAADKDDARQWAYLHSAHGRDAIYAGMHGVFAEPRTLTPSDKIVRTARFREHPSWETIEAGLAGALERSSMTESITGLLVRQERP